MRGLYAIVDTDALDKRGLDAVAFTRAVLAAHPAALQIRDKSSGAARTLEILRAVAPLAERADVPLFANDRPDLAILAGAAGVHVGQEDLPVDVVRALAARAGAISLAVGLSTHDAAQVDAGCAAAPDYLAIGPIFQTSSKDRPSPVVGLDGLAALAARARAASPRLPLVAIGGIGLAEAARVGAIADAVAVIGALLPEPGAAAPWDEITEKARALHALIRGEERAS